MAKRMICVWLVLVLVAGIVPINASAEETQIGLRLLGEGESYTNLLVSQNMLDMIKDVEGFSPTPYWDVSQWTIGYGTACGYNWSDKPNMTVTREEAEILLINEVNEKYARIVNEYCASIGRQPNQNQFDALVDFTYNLGGSWTRGCMLTDWLENPTTELDFVNAIGRWGRISSKVSYATCMRRIREAIIFMKGEYYLTYGNGSFETSLEVVSNHDLPYYKVVIYLCDGGQINGLTDDVSYHFIGQTYDSFLTPEREDHTFTGWKVTKIRSYGIDEPFLAETGMTVEDNIHVTAQWEAREPDGTEPEVTDPEVTEPEATEPEATEPEATEPEVTEPEVTEPEVTEPEVTEPEVTEPEVTEPEITEPEATEPEVTEPEVTEPEVTEPEATEPEVTEPEVTEPEHTGILGVVNTGVLRIRSGPGSEFRILGELIRNNTVEILEQHKIGSSNWGRISTGWICLDYVDMNPAEGFGTPVPPSEPSDPESTDVFVRINTNVLRIRSGPGIGFKVMGELLRDEVVEVYEQHTIDSSLWGRVEQGWICLDYTVFTDEPQTPHEPPQPTEPDEAFPFEDVPADCWYREAVEFVYRNGYMNGISKTLFGSEDTMTRAMLVTVLYRMAGEPELQGEDHNLFTDVTDSDYFADAVIWAKENSIVHGVSESSFAPNRKVSRQDAIVIFHRYYTTYLHRDGNASADLDAFVDKKDVAPYAVDAMAWAVENGIINGSAGVEGMLLNPRSDLTRAQAARLMYMLDCMIAESE